MLNAAMLFIPSKMLILERDAQDDSNLFFF